jgi:hypothetical protein
MRSGPELAPRLARPPRLRTFPGTFERHGNRKRAAVAKLAPAYRPRRPQDTVLHRVVRAHLETFIEHARETYAAPLPKYVREELRGYLRCGIFEHGFTRARCESCNHDVLIAFSCKARGLCPSCAGRRMCNTAAHIVDRVIPSVPVRQWVLSLPFDVRARAAYDARFLTEVIRAFARALRERHRAWARSIALDDSEFAAITFVQRFGSSLNLNVHLHVVVVDGVFSRDGDVLAFTAASPPTRAEMMTILRKVRTRVDKLATRPTGDLQLPLAACVRVALSPGEVRAVSVDLQDDEPHASPPEPHDGSAVEIANYNLEASVRIAADDDFGREHLLRYCARPPLSLVRLIALPHGNLGYRIKKLRNHRNKLRIMTPLELLARLAALIPPPRHPLVRFHGAFAPRSSWRKLVVPKSPNAEPKPKHHHDPPNENPAREPSNPAATKPSPTKPSARPPATRTPASAGAPALIAETHWLAPNVLSVRHWERIRCGALAATSARIDWPTLMSRTFDVDVLDCSKCGGRLRILALVDDEDTATAILDELAIERTPPPARARDPSTLEHDPDADDTC